MIITAYFFLSIFSTSTAINCMKYPFSLGCRGVVSLAPEYVNFAKVKRVVPVKVSQHDIDPDTGAIVDFTSSYGECQTQGYDYQPGSDQNFIKSIFSQILRPNSQIKRTAPNLFSGILRRMDSLQAEKKNGNRNLFSNILRKQ